MEENTVDIEKPTDLDSIIAFLTQDTLDQGDEEDGIIIQPPSTVFQTLQGLRTVLRFQEYTPSSQHEDIHLP